MFGGVLGLLAELAAAAPVLLVLEDLHWADASTRDLVTFLSRMLHRERVALIGSYRTDDLHRRHPLRPVVAELLRLPSVTAVDLAPLDPSALAEHLRRRRPRPHRRHRAERHRRPRRGQRLLRRGTARRLGQRGSRAAQHPPGGLAALLLSRVEQLSDAAQQVLRAAAVAGRKADDELVRAASGLAAADYEAAVREAVTHQLLVADGSEGYVFRHALLREAVYADLLPGERTRLHATMSSLLADEQRLTPARDSRRAGPALPGQPRHSRRVRRIDPGRGGSGTARRAGRGAPPLRPGAGPVGPGGRAGEGAGMARGELGLLSATNAADSGDVERAVHLLRRLRHLLDTRRPGRPRATSCWPAGSASGWPSTCC